MDSHGGRGSLLRPAVFTVQVTIRDMRKSGREDEAREISKAISEIEPELLGDAEGEAG